ncbi:MAG: glycoside hydrolase family 3 C-terminal domain-containing protein [Candidatus Krumholzibacteriia bacterium]
MRRRDSFTMMVALAVLAGTFAAAAAQPYRDPDLPVEARVRDILARMTPLEKRWQLFMVAEDLDAWDPDTDPGRYAHGVCGLQVPAAWDASETIARGNRIQRRFVEGTRLGIPVILFAEALHGLAQEGATAFPQAIGLAATFDTALMSDVAAAVAGECRDRGVRQVLSPVVNVATDVRWGRTEETYGEDPFLASAMGVSFVAAFTREGIITTPKHLVANVGDGGRDSYPIGMDERLLREVHLPPFRACIDRGGSRSVMTSYNSLDGVPCSASGWLNDTLLKGEWGFSGFVISDAGAVGGANVLHFTASGYPDAGSQALQGGLDVIFQTSPDHFGLFFPGDGDDAIPPAVIDAAVARVLRAKLELGLFEQPYAVGSSIMTDAAAATHRALARRTAQESLVLLKNEAGTLPLRRDLREIAVVGPDAAEVRLGGYSGPGNDPVSILEGIRAAAGPAGRIVHAEGCSRGRPALVTVPGEYLSCRRGERIVPGLLGAYHDNVSLDGTPILTRVDDEIDFRWTLASPDPDRLASDFYSVRWTGVLTGPVTGPVRIGLEGDDGFRLYLDDDLVIDRRRKVSHRTETVGLACEEGRRYNLRIEFNEPGGNGRIRLVWDHGGAPDEDRSLKEAVDLAAGSDVAVVVVGLEEGEFRDRARLGLPGRQGELIERIAATGVPVAVVVVGGSAVTMSGWLDRVGAVVMAWYPGEAGGAAVADVLFGDVSPAGRLPITFPVAEGQLPLTYSHRPTGRGDDYVDLTGLPLFPFGYGLSYTEFAYGGLVLEPGRIAVGDSAVVRFTVENTGPVAGDEVVQLYVRDELATVAQPVTALKGFQRVHLLPGEARELRFVIRPDMLAMLDRDLRPVIEPGDFRIMIGASSRDVRLRGTLTVGP